MEDFQNRVLEVVRSVTGIEAYFFCGTMFLETADSVITTKVFSALHEKITQAISYGRYGCDETFFDFIG